MFQASKKGEKPITHSLNPAMLNSENDERWVFIESNIGPLLREFTG